MKRREFIALWMAIRSQNIWQCVKDGTMRHSEACMTLAEVPKDALKLWLKMDFKSLTQDQLLGYCAVDPDKWAGVKESAALELEAMKEKGGKR